MTRNDFAIVLRKKNFEEETIQRILKKRIKTVLERGKVEEIEKILDVLEEKEIRKEKIENCLSVLAFGKAEEIGKILDILEKKGIRNMNNRNWF